MRTGREIHRLVIRLHPLRHRHGCERRDSLGNDFRPCDAQPACGSRQATSVACCVSSTRHIAARRCSAKQLSAPNSASVRSSSFVNGHAPFEIIDRLKRRCAPFLDQVRSACSWRRPFTTQNPSRTVSSETTVQRHSDCIHAHRLHLESVPVRVFHDRGRRIKTHRLIVQQTRVKLRRAMHLQIRAAIGENGKTDRVRLREIRKARMTRSTE